MIKIGKGESDMMQSTISGLSDIIVLAMPKGSRIVLMLDSINIIAIK